MAKRRVDIKIKLEPHALERWREHVGKEKKRQIEEEVRRHLIPTLKMGLPADLSVRKKQSEWGFLLRLRPHLFAVVKPEMLGGWAVVTFHVGEQLKGSGNVEELVSCPRCGVDVRLLEGFNVCQKCTYVVTKEGLEKLREVEEAEREKDTRNQGQLQRGR